MKEKTSLSNYLETLQSEGRYYFLRQDIIQVLQISDNAFRKAAQRIIHKGKLTRIRGDFYTIIPPEYRATGSLPATWFIDSLMNALGQPYYVGLLTAAALQGASHQQPMVFQVITDKPMRPITVGQVYIEFHYKKNIKPYCYQLQKTASGTMNVSTPEVTAFDLMRYISAVGQVNHVATVLCELVEQLHPIKLATLLKQGDVEIATAQRLGYLLDILKLEFDLEPLYRQLKKTKYIYRPLVGGTQSIIEYNSRWRVSVNEIVEPDEI